LKHEADVLPLEFRKVWIGLSVLLVGAVLAACLYPRMLVIPAGADKFEHLAAYLVLSIWFGGIIARRWHAWVAIGLLGFGIVIELLQGLPMIGRSQEVADVVANAIGITVGLLYTRSVLDGWALAVEARISRRSNRAPSR
jgi:VanZ family protein